MTEIGVQVESVIIFVRYTCMILSSSLWLLIITPILWKNYTAVLGFMKKKGVLSAIRLLLIYGHPMN